MSASFWRSDTHALRLRELCDVLRLSADEGDRSRPILCSWKVLSSTMDPIASSSGVWSSPTRARRSSAVRLSVVVGGLVDEIDLIRGP